MNRKSIKQLKAGLVQKIEQIQDETVLQMMQEAVEAYSTVNRKDILDELTPEQLARLRKSVQQAEEGQTSPHEDIKAKAGKWLTNKLDLNC